MPEHHCVCEVLYCEDIETHNTGQPHRGPIGALGPNGARGLRGFQGYQGPNVTGHNLLGFQGAMQPDDNSAYVIVKGNQGPLGDDGNKGPRGVDGVNAVVESVHSGPQGMQGFAAPEGGAQGSDGFDGEEGPRGMITWLGAQGIKGDQGLQGNHGMRGNTGYEGKQGQRGSQGRVNEPARGPQGFDGYRGMQGFVGDIGSQGYNGTEAIDGYQGSQGLQGFEADLGTQGFRGQDASEHDDSPTTQGFMGPQGFIGSQGDTGFEGINSGYNLSHRSFRNSPLIAVPVLTNNNDTYKIPEHKFTNMRGLVLCLFEASFKVIDSDPWMNARFIVQIIKLYEGFPPVVLSETCVETSNATTQICVALHALTTFVEQDEVYVVVKAGINSLVNKQFYSYTITESMFSAIVQTYVT